MRWWAGHAGLHTAWAVQGHCSLPALQLLRPANSEVRQTQDLTAAKVTVSMSLQVVGIRAGFVGSESKVTLHGAGVSAATLHGWL